MATKFILILVLITTTVVVLSDALQCHQCGQYNDGVGSITPCLNYSEHLAHLHLKSCPRATDQYCIVSLMFFFKLFIQRAFFFSFEFY